MLDTALNSLVATLKAISYHSEYIKNEQNVSVINHVFREEIAKRDRMNKEARGGQDGSQIPSIPENESLIHDGIANDEDDHNLAEEQSGTEDSGQVEDGNRETQFSETPIEIIVPRNKGGRGPGEQADEEEDEKYLRVVFFSGIEEDKAGLALREANPPPPHQQFHPAPDPLLLLAKAAVVWGKMTGFEIIANGEEDDDAFDGLEESLSRFSNDNSIPSVVKLDPLIMTEDCLSFT